MTQKRPGAEGAAEEAWTRAVVEAVQALSFGSVEIVVHDGRVVQVETREKVRFDEVGRRRPGHPGADFRKTPAGPTATSGGAAPLLEDTSE